MAWPKYPRISPARHGTFCTHSLYQVCKVLGAGLARTITCVVPIHPPRRFAWEQNVFDLEAFFSHPERWCFVAKYAWGLVEATRKNNIRLVSSAWTGFSWPFKFARWWFGEVLYVLGQRRKAQGPMPGRTCA